MNTPWRCRVFGHKWHYQPEWLSERVGQPPARTCERSRCWIVQRLIDGTWQDWKPEPVAVKPRTCDWCGSWPCECPEVWWDGGNWTA